MADNSNRTFRGYAAESGSFSKLHPAFRDPLQKFYQEAADAGIPLKPGSSFRSIEEQRRLYADRENNRYPVAPPGSSGHNYGLAQDFTPGVKLTPEVQDKLDEIATKNGLVYGGRFNDPIHVQYGPNSFSELSGSPRGEQGFVDLPADWNSRAQAYLASGKTPAADSPNTADTADILDESAPKKEKGTSSRDSYSLNVLMNAANNLGKREKVAMLPIPRLSYATGGIADLAKGYATGGAATDMTVSAASDPIETLYNKYTGHASDPGGKALWETKLSGMTPEQQDAEFLQGANQYYASNTAHTGPVSDAQIQGMYEQFAGRTADQGGLDYWKQKAAEPGATYASLSKQFQKDVASSGADTTVKTPPWLEKFDYENFNNSFDAGYDYLKRTLGNNAAAALYGNFNTESFVNPQQLQTNFKTGAPKFDKLTNMPLGMGLAQWDPERQNKLYRFADRYGLDPNSTEGQLRYVVNEITTTPKLSKWLDRIQNPKTSISDATQILQNKYEVPRDKLATLAARRADADMFSRNANKGVVTPAEQAKIDRIRSASKDPLFEAKLNERKQAAAATEAAKAAADKAKLASTDNPFDQTGLNPTATSSDVGNEWLNQQQTGPVTGKDAAGNEIQKMYDTWTSNLINDANKAGTAGWDIGNTNTSSYSYVDPNQTSLYVSPFSYVSPTDYSNPTQTYTYDSGGNYGYESPYAEGGEVQFTPLFEGDRPEFQQEAKRLGQQAYSDIKSLSPEDLAKWKKYAEVYNLPLSTAGTDNSYEDQVGSYMRSLQQGPSQKQRSQSYADGGDVSATTDYAPLVQSLYGTLGRTGIGTGANQIDQAGLNYWTNQLQSGAATPESITSQFQTSAKDYMAANPTSNVSQYVQNYLNPTSTAATNTGAITGTTTGATTTGAATSATTAQNDALIKNAYASIGRSGVGTAANQIDQAGYDYWLNKLQNGSLSPADFNSSFTKEATDYMNANKVSPVTTAVSNKYDQMVKDAYASLGRKGFGTNTNQIDQAGYDYWLNKLTSGEIPASDFKTAFDAGAADYLKNNQNDLSKYVSGYQASHFDASKFAQKDGKPSKVSTNYDPYKSKEFVVAKPSMDTSKVKYPSVKDLYEALGTSAPVQSSAPRVSSYPQYQPPARPAAATPTMTVQQAKDLAATLTANNKI